MERVVADGTTIAGWFNISMNPEQGSHVTRGRKILEGAIRSTADRNSDVTLHKDAASSATSTLDKWCVGGVANEHEGDMIRRAVGKFVPVSQTDYDHTSQLLTILTSVDKYREIRTLWDDFVSVSILMVLLVILRWLFDVL